MIDGIIDKDTARMAPLLVRLYDTHSVYALAKDKSAPARAELVGIIVDMFEAELSPVEAELVADVLIGLMRQAEIDLRRSLSNSLSSSDKIPLRLALHLANDEISVAEPMLTSSPVLNDMDLIYIVKSQGPDYWRAIAKRKCLSDQVMDLLVDTEEPGTVINLAHNKEIHLTDYTLKTAARMAMENENLAGPLLERDEIPKEIALPLYRFVGDNLKKQIIDRYSVNKTEIEGALSRIVNDIASYDSHVFMPSGGMCRAAETAHKEGRLSVKAMIEVLRKGEISLFVAMFAVYAKVSPSAVIDMLAHRYSQGMAVACRALDIEKADFLTIYFLTQRVRRANRIANKHDINQALAYFERTKKDVALRLLENSRI